MSNDQWNTLNSCEESLTNGGHADVQSAVTKLHEWAIKHQHEHDKEETDVANGTFTTRIIKPGAANYMAMVKEFHEMIGLDVFCQSSNEIMLSRLRLILEEVSELAEAADKCDVVAIADALADILYVVFGTAIVLNLPMDEIFRQVHASNMTKRGGHTEGGKWIKPATYKPVDLSWLLKGADK
jgi:predicted HAD superfamily Cof-like phosphohydrolase